MTEPELEDRAERGFEMLGPIRAWRSGRPVSLGSPQQQAVLAMLLPADGRQVTLDALVDGLWGEQPPRTAIGALRTYVSRLRRAFQPDQRGGRPETVIQSTGAGYLLDLGRATVDVGSFEQRLRTARSAVTEQDVTRALYLYEAALSLWRGTRCPVLTVPTPPPSASGWRSCGRWRKNA